MKNSSIKSLIVFFSLGSLVLTNACDITGDNGCNYDVGRSVYSQGDRLSAKIFYPCNIDELSNVGATTLTSGMTGSKENMYWLAQPIADAGMVVVTVSATDNMTVEGYETAQKTGHGILMEENDNHNSPIYGKIGNYGLMGYSKGGGGAINAASDLDTQVKSCIALAPWGANKQKNMRAATLILTGTADTITPATMGLSYYHGLPDISKAYGSVENGSHFFWVSNNDSGEIEDLIIGWLKYYLEDDESYLSDIQNRDDEFTDYEYIDSNNGESIVQNNDNGCS
ncbi:MAG: hypothetical protein PVI90_11235 [Desulfobacteraceae bacterium]|jgi:dienelactone hydrolase